MLQSGSSGVRLLLAGLVALCGTISTGWARDTASDNSAVINIAQLPAEGRLVWTRIHTGGPFDYDKDGTVFGNRERQLPRNVRGYYLEYTVKTPGIKHRGTRRIVCGGQQPSKPEACYYTPDHYASFKRIVE
jgi:ribonuclease T1